MTFQAAVDSGVPRVGHPQFSSYTYVDLTSAQDGYVLMYAQGGSPVKFTLDELRGSWYFEDSGWYAWDPPKPNTDIEPERKVEVRYGKARKADHSGR